jgi:acyl dehydratase
LFFSSAWGEPVFFDDFSPGDRFTTGSRTLTEAEIVGFAGQWDRQFFHLDAEAAKGSIFGGLIASGFHTLLVTFDLVVEAAIWTESSQGSPGFEQLRWLKPVRPGDALTVEVEVVETTPSRKGDRGYVVWDHTTRNQAGETVMTFRSTGILMRRPPGPEPTT